MGPDNNRKPNAPVGIAKVNGPSAIKADLTPIKSEITKLERAVADTRGKQSSQERGEMKSVLFEMRAIVKDIENNLAEPLKKLNGYMLECKKKGQRPDKLKIQKIETTIQKIIKDNYQKIEGYIQQLKQLVNKDSADLQGAVNAFAQAAQQQKEKLVLSSGVNQAIATTSNVPQQSQAQEKPEAFTKNSAQVTDISELTAGPSSQVEDNTHSDTAATSSETMLPLTKEMGTMTEETQTEAYVKNRELHTMQDQLEAARKQLFDLAGDIENFRRDIDQRDSQIVDLMAEKDKLELTINSLETKNTENLDAKTGIEEQLKVQASELEAVKKSASEATEALSKLQESFNNIKDALRAEQENFAKYRNSAKRRGIT
ncbi:hypothetical protein RVIR1_11360 [Candidatus Rickettsiella viridis]|uniref:Uncharacterized protein n=1 Tax=Candidatus Rickettsiella viridis TaxID=676208 RepID=A0A2Z5UX64_9COXI|nr:hypothetical protein [Candidatus Rickettsiella viridis]BBB15600.1 hypothetical protein RVIR1_11360 [Candidatus Rickettsiella viridis]